MIIEKIMEEKAKRIKQWPVRTNRASELGHDCIRYLVLNRTRWQEKKLHDVSLQLIFDEGNLHEAAVMRDIENAGYIIVEQQRPFDWPEYNITGHVDGKILMPELPTGKIPLEIKSCSPFIFPHIYDMNSLINSKFPWMRKYPAQITLYLLMDNEEQGLIIFKNKTSGELKEVLINLDYDLGERLLQKAEAVNKHVAEKTLPNCIPYDEAICGRCDYQHICLPEIVRGALDLTTDPELEETINRYFVIKETAQEYKSLDDKIKAVFSKKQWEEIADAGGHGKIVVGNYLITGKRIDKKDGSNYWKRTITPIKEAA